MIVCDSHQNSRVLGGIVIRQLEIWKRIDQDFGNRYVVFRIESLGISQKNCKPEKKISKKSIAKKEKRTKNPSGNRKTKRRRRSC
jgi:hypothetical protein